MKILVCISVVPDTTSKITFKNNNTEFNSDWVQYIINPYDELALSKSLEFAEQLGGTVTVIHVGLADSEPVIRKALAIGASDAVRINALPKDALFVSHNISEYIKSNSYDLVFTGRESIDYNSGMVGGMISEFLDWPCINIVSECSIAQNEVTATRDIDGGKETLKCTLPCVLSAQKDLCEVRIPNMRGIMGARTKNLQIIEPNNEYNLVSYVSYALPEAKQGIKMINPENAEELIELLKSEKKLF